jgi:glycosyltransferase involved in cell wall biosynthesis
MRPIDTRVALGDAHDVRAIFVLNSLNVGGSETKTIRVVNGLWRRGVRAGIAYLNEPRKLLDALDPEVPAWNLARQGKFSVATVKRLRALIRSARPDCVFPVNMYPALYTSLATAGLRPQPRTIALLNTTLLAGKDQWRRSFYRPFLRRMDGIVFGCELQRQEWQPFLGAEQSRCGVIYNGVDTQHFAPFDRGEVANARYRLGIPLHAFVIGSVGRLAVEKNHVALLDAAAELLRQSVDVHVMLVGAGAKRADLEQRARELRLSSRVTFAGVQRDVRPCLAAMDAFVLPSTHIETFSNAALEAMSMATPVILSEVGGAKEMIRDGVDGYTVPCSSLATTLPRLLSRLHADPDLRQAMGRAARERAVACFSSQSMVDEFAALISQPYDLQTVR